MMLILSLKSSRQFAPLIALLFALTLSCIYPTHDSDRAETLDERYSVWQYLSVFSIYQDKIPDDPWRYSPEELFDIINDTLRGHRYTDYVDYDYYDDDFDDWGFIRADVTVVPYDNSTLYLHIPIFHYLTLWDFQDHIPTIAAYENIIIDLRENPGGFLDVCHDMLSEFLPYGTEFIKDSSRFYDPQSRRGFTRSEVLKTTNKNPRLLNKNIVVLINENSASAAEVMASALRDAAGAYLVGSQSHGKGIGQYYIPRTGRKELSITVMRLSGLSLRTGDYHGIGLVPDDMPEGCMEEADPIMREELDIYLNNLLENDPELYEYYLEDPDFYETTIKYWSEQYCAQKVLIPYSTPSAPKMTSMAGQAARLAKQSRTANRRPVGMFIRLEPDLLK
ncbi:MAG: S41 family peptidase [Chitinispirillales bacterium]|jgi:hypothetical protein|nr:S41 family peptidase [Chitinispirillales bacterium]